VFDLICTVRNCGKPLTLSDCLRCEAGHHFDRSKSGYWNLSQPQDKKSLNPGDSEEAVDARSKWLELGFGEGIIAALRSWLKDFSTESAQARVLDLGCGEGSFGDALFSGDSYSYCGIDFSKKAIKLASSRFKHLTWVMANADRFLPAATGSVDCVISLFGRRPTKEIARVLQENGHCIVAVPGQNDLSELRKVAQKDAKRRNRWEPIVEEFQAEGLQLIEQKNWLNTVQLSRESASLALAMTYRAVRHSQQERLSQLEEQTQVTLEADMLLFRRV